MKNLRVLFLRFFLNIPMWMFILVAVGFSLFAINVSAEPFLSNVQSDIGVVNGVVVNGDTVRAEKRLVNPILLSVMISDMDGGIRRLLIGNAELIKQNNSDILIRIAHALPQGGVGQTEICLGLWVDGQQIPLAVSAIGSEVIIEVPEGWHQMELRAVSPVFIELPRRFRGEFDFGMTLRGLST